MLERLLQQSSPPPAPPLRPFHLQRPPPMRLHPLRRLPHLQLLSHSLSHHLSESLVPPSPLLASLPPRPPSLLDQQAPPLSPLPFLPSCLPRTTQTWVPSLSPLLPPRLVLHPLPPPPPPTPHCPRTSPRTCPRTTTSTWMRCSAYLQSQEPHLYRANSDRSHLLIKDCPFCHPIDGKADNQWKLTLYLPNANHFCHRCRARGSWYDMKKRPGRHQRPRRHSQRPAFFSPTTPKDSPHSSKKDTAGAGETAGLAGGRRHQTAHVRGSMAAVPPAVEGLP